MKTPDYVLSEAYVTYQGSTQVEYPVGMFVRPIDPYYLPKHILDSDSHRWFNSQLEVYCYTSLGIVKFPKNIVRKV